MERRHVRVPMSAARAQLMSLGHWCHAQVVDLSLGGARIASEEPLSPGARARLQLTLAGHAVSVESTVAWARGGDGLAGVVFDPLTAAQRRALADTIVRAGHRDDTDDGAVLLVIIGAPVEATLTNELLARGFAVAVSPTPLDAIQRLEHHEPPICAAIVSQRLPGGASDHLLALLADDYPEIRRVLLLDPAATAGDRAGSDGRRADRVLLSPWAPDDLAAVFELIGERGPRL
jgi:hypothetical protein